MVLPNHNLIVLVFLTHAGVTLPFHDHAARNTVFVDGVSAAVRNGRTARAFKTA
jgi:hypothetical protein